MPLPCQILAWTVVMERSDWLMVIWMIRDEWFRDEWKCALVGYGVLCVLTSTGTIEKLGQSAGSWATLTCLVSLLLAINLHVVCIYSNTTKYMQKVVTLYIVCVYRCVIPANTHTHIRTLIHPWVITTTKIPSPITVSPVCITAFKVSYSPPPQMLWHWVVQCTERGRIQFSWAPSTAQGRRVSCLDAVL